MKTLFTDMNLTINSHCTLGLGCLCLFSVPAISGVLRRTERSCLRLRTSGPGSGHNAESGGSWLPPQSSSPPPTPAIIGLPPRHHWADKSLGWLTDRVITNLCINTASNHGSCSTQLIQTSGAISDITDIFHTCVS